MRQFKMWKGELTFVVLHLAPQYLIMSDANDNTTDDRKRLTELMLERLQAMKGSANWKLGETKYCTLVDPPPVSEKIRRRFLTSTFCKR